MELIKKLNWRWLMMLAAVMMMGVTMTACGDDDDEEEGHPNEYVGVWADAEDLVDGYDRVFAVELDADGTGRDGEWYVEGEYFTPESDYEWEWSVDGNNMTISAEGESRTCRFEVSDDGRYATMYDDGDVLVYVKVR